MIFDKNIEIITNSNYAEITAGRNGYTVPTEAEAYAKAAGLNTRRSVGIGMDIQNHLEDYFEHFYKIFPMTPFTESSFLFDLVSAASMTSSGDHTVTAQGISGDGSYYFNGIAIPSTEITDINNFSMGVYSHTDDDTGVDLGSNDGTNEQSISCKSGGNFIVKNGTATISTAQTGGAGHFVMNNNNGVLKAFYNGSEVGTSTAVTGSLSSLQPLYLGALNNNGTDANHSSKRYGLCWLYNGRLDDNDMLRIHNTLIRTTQKNIGR